MHYYRYRCLQHIPNVTLLCTVLIRKEMGISKFSWYVEDGEGWYICQKYWCLYMQEVEIIFRPNNGITSEKDLMRPMLLILFGKMVAKFSEQELLHGDNRKQTENCQATTRSFYCCCFWSCRSAILNWCIMLDLQKCIFPWSCLLVVHFLNCRFFSLWETFY